MSKLYSGLFLDRDGVINHNFGYVHTVKDFTFIPGIFELCSTAMNAQMKIVIVTNQSGIGRGFFTQHQFDELMSWVVDQFRVKGIVIAATLFATEDPDNESSVRGVESRRKPSPAMFLEAAKEFMIDLESSIMVGDMPSDMVAAANAGVKCRILVGKTDENCQQTTTVTNLQEATEVLQNFILDLNYS